MAARPSCFAQRNSDPKKYCASTIPESKEPRRPPAAPSTPTERPHSDPSGAHSSLAITVEPVRTMLMVPSALSKLTPDYSKFGSFPSKLAIQPAGLAIDLPDGFRSKPCKCGFGSFGYRVPGPYQSGPPPDFRPENFEYRVLSGRSQ